VSDWTLQELLGIDRAAVAAVEWVVDRTGWLADAACPVGELRLRDVAP
jgi:hypothetical protein